MTKNIFAKLYLVFKVCIESTFMWYTVTTSQAQSQPMGRKEFEYPRV